MKGFFFACEVHMPRTLSEEQGKLAAFRCRTCGRLHSSDYAGELPHPSKCCVCGGGCVFRHQSLADSLKEAIEKGDTQKALDLTRELRGCDPVSKTIQPENWEVLTDCTPERLKELGIETPVIKHQLWTKPLDAEDRPPKAHEVGIGERHKTVDAAK